MSEHRSSGSPSGAPTVAKKHVENFSPKTSGKDEAMYSFTVEEAPTPSESDNLVQSLSRKKFGFVRLKDWEEERLARHTRLCQLLEPVQEGLKTRLQQSHNVTVQISKLLGEVAKVSCEWSRQLQLSSVRSGTKHSLVQSNQTSYAQCVDPNNVIRSSAYRGSKVVGFGAWDTQDDSACRIETIHPIESVPLPESNPDGKPKKNNGDRGVHRNRPGSLNREAETHGRKETSPTVRLFLRNYFPNQECEPWLLSLIELNQQTALQIEALGTFIEHDLVQGHLIRLCEEYDRRANALFEQVKRKQAAVLKLQESCVALWHQFENVFRDVEKGYFEESVLKPQRKHHCCWIYERRYLIAAKKIILLERQYIQILIKNVVALQQLEQWRCTVLRRVLQSYVMKFKTSVNVILMTLGSLSGVLDRDADGEESVSQNVELSKSQLGSGNYYYRKLLKEQLLYLDSRGTPQKPAESHTNSHNSRELTENGVFEPNNTAIYKYLGTPTALDKPNDKVDGSKHEAIGLPSREPFKTALDQLAFPPLPPSPFIIKIAPVKRTSGMGFFQKWLDGILVLTWDRFLHMFKTMDDLIPVWSLCLPFNEPKVPHERLRDKALIIELRERKKSYVLSSKSLFKVETAAEYDEWMKCLMLTCTGETFFSSTTSAALEAVSKTWDGNVVEKELSSWSSCGTEEGGSDVSNYEEQLNGVPGDPSDKRKSSVASSSLPRLKFNDLKQKKNYISTSMEILNVQASQAPEWDDVSRSYSFDESGPDWRSGQYNTQGSEEMNEGSVPIPLAINPFADSDRDETVFEGPGSNQDTDDNRDDTIGIGFDSGYLDFGNSV